jgi:hypothetical protein
VAQTRNALDSLEGLALERLQQLRRRHTSRERHSLTRPQGEEVRRAGLSRSGAQLRRKLALGRKRKLREIGTRRLADEAIARRAGLPVKRSVSVVSSSVAASSAAR